MSSDGDDLTVRHAVYDVDADKFYVILASHPNVLHQVSRASLRSKWKTKAGVELTFLTKHDRHRNFLSLSMDSTTRLLYACSNFGDVEGDIAVYLVRHDNAELVATIKSSIRPSYSAVNFATPQQLFYMYSSSAMFGSKDNDDADIKEISLLAIGSVLDNTVELYAMDFNSFASKIEQNYESGGVAFNTSQASIKQGFKKIATVAQWNRTGTDQPGSVYGPRELHFDPAGRLIVADEYNFRFQLFAMTGNQQNLMSPVFVSEETGWQLWSTAIVMPDATTGRITALATKYNDVLAYEFDE